MLCIVFPLHVSACGALLFAFAFVHRYVEEKHANEGTAGGSGWNDADDGREAGWRGVEHAVAIADAVHDAVLYAFSSHC